MACIPLGGSEFSETQLTRKRMTFAYSTSLWKMYPRVRRAQPRVESLESCFNQRWTQTRIMVQNTSFKLMQQRHVYTSQVNLRLPFGKVGMFPWVASMVCGLHTFLRQKISLLGIQFRKWFPGKTTLWLLLSNLFNLHSYLFLASPLEMFHYFFSNNKTS